MNAVKKILPNPKYIKEKNEWMSSLKLFGLLELLPIKSLKNIPLKIIKYKLNTWCLKNQYLLIKMFIRFF